MDKWSPVDELINYSLCYFTTSCYRIAKVLFKAMKPNTSLELGKNFRNEEIYAGRELKVGKRGF